MRMRFSIIIPSYNVDENLFEVCLSSILKEYDVFYEVLIVDDGSKVLRNPVMVLEPFYQLEKYGHIDFHSFVSEVLRKEPMGLYINVTALADIVVAYPFSKIYMLIL